MSPCIASLFKFKVWSSITANKKDKQEALSGGDFLAFCCFGERPVEACPGASSATAALGGDFQFIAKIAQGASPPQYSVVNIAFSYGMAKADVHINLLISGSIVLL